MSTIHENIPEDLKKNGLFCVWRYIIIDGVKKKVPYNPISGKPACTNDVDTFGTFEDAVMAMSRGKYDGIGVLIIAITKNISSNRKSGTSFYNRQQIQT